MPMLHLLVASLLPLAPQDPAAPATPAPAPVAAPTQRAETNPSSSPPSASSPQVAPEHWLPPDALAAVVVAPLTANAGGLESMAAWTKLIDMVLSKMPLPQQASAALIGRALRNGAAFAWLPGEPKQGPELLLVAALGDTEREVAAALASLPSAGSGAVRVANGRTKTFFWVQNGRLAVGTSLAAVTAASARALKPGGKSLADEPAFAAALPANGDVQLVQAFVRIDGVVKAITDRLPSGSIDNVRSFQRAARLDQLQWASASWRIAGGDLVTDWRIGGTDVPPWIAAFAGSTGRLDPSLAAVVPADATGYGFYAVDLGNVVDQLLPVVSAMVPQAGSAFDGMLKRLEAQTGIDARAVLLGTLAGRIVTANSGDNSSVMFELKQGTTYAKMLQRLVPALGLPVQTGTVAGLPCWRVVAGSDGKRPVFAVVGNWLAISSSDDAFTAVAQQVQNAQPNGAAAEFLRTVDPATSWATFGQAPNLASWSEELKPLLAEAGPTRCTLQRQDGALTLEQRVDPAVFLRMADALVEIASAKMTGAVTAARATGAGAGGADAEAVRQLQAAEKAGPTPENVPVVEHLLEHADPKIAARAAWLLGDWKIRQAAEALAGAAVHHNSPAVRLQAMSALARVADESVLEAVTTATTDAEPRIRALAAQALGHIDSEIATASLLGLLEKYGKEPVREPPVDLITALLVLHDRGQTSAMLPAASAIKFSQPQLGQALTFLFQDLSPKLEPKTEAKTLIAVLDHPESMLRHYAIQRLGELRDPSTAPALEGRLAKEGAELQPLIHVSLAQVRGDTQHTGDDLLGRAKSNVAAIAQMIQRRWSTMPLPVRLAVAGGAAAILVLGVVTLVWLRRARRRAHADAVAAMVAPSQSYYRGGEPAQEEEELVGAGHGDR
jgi:hypothetical protein